MSDALDTIRGVIRSLRIYYGDPARKQTIDAMHARFLKRGDLAFDIGSHVGDRVASFRRLGARVVALEPQPALVRTLRVLFALDRKVRIEAAAVGRAAGEIELNLNLKNPTVATASDDFIKAADGALGWEEQRWTRKLKVPMTTLDALIAKHGTPQFVKIDVEGFEDEVLAGLSQPLAALSLEFTTIQRDVAVRAIERLAAAAPYRFTASLGENQRFEHETALDAAGITAWLSDLPLAANSGDIFASLNASALGPANPRAN